MEESPFFPSLLRSALPSSIIILSRISLLYRRVSSLQSISRILRGTGKREPWNYNKAEHTGCGTSRVLFTFSLLPPFVELSLHESYNLSIYLDLYEMLGKRREKERIECSRFHRHDVYQLLTTLSIDRALFLENLQKLART